MENNNLIKGSQRIFDEIIDIMNELEMSLEKAEFICQDINEDYFGKTDPNPNDLKWDYKRYAVKADIVADCICEAEKATKIIKRCLQAFEKGESINSTNQFFCLGFSDEEIESMLINKNDQKATA